MELFYLPFGTKIFNFSGVNAFWNKKLTIFDKTHTVKYTRNTYYWDKLWFFEKIVWFHETNGVTLHIGTNNSILTKIWVITFWNWALQMHICPKFPDFGYKTYCWHFWFKSHFGVLCGAFCNNITFSFLLILTTGILKQPITAEHLILYTLCNTKKNILTITYQNNDYDTLA